MTSIDINDISEEALVELGIVFPYEQRPSRDEDPRYAFTEEQWAAYQWNPPETGDYDSPDPAATEKPSWDQLGTAVRLSVVLLRQFYDDAYISTGKSGDYRYIPGPAEIKRGITDTGLLPEEGVYVGAGLDHMTGLLQMVEQANSAGAHLPHIVMRDADQKRRSLHTQERIRSILDSTARRENIVESAHNAVLERYHAQAGIRDDVTADLGDRETAAEKARTIAKDYKAELEKEIAAYDPNKLPEDLPTLKEVYIERLEAAATGHQRNLKGALSQQAIDNWAACVDMDTALAEVAKRTTLGVIEIEAAEDDIWVKESGAWARVTDISALPAEEEHEGDDPPAASLGADGEHYRQFTGVTEAKTAYDAARRAVEAVTAANIPTWTVTRHGSVIAVGYEDGDKVMLRNATRIIVDCKQVSGVEGRVAQRTPQASYGDGSPAPLKMRTLRRPPGQTNWHSAVIEVRDGETKPVTVRLTGRNLCGPSKLTVTLIP